MKTKNYSPGIIIFSAYSKDGIKNAFHGLRIGAIDFVSKPDGEFSPDLEKTKTELIFKIKTAANAYLHTLTKTQIIPPSTVTTKLSKKPRVVVLGASTGGPPILEKILKGLSPDLKCPILIVQHMPQKFTSIFAELTNKKTKIEVLQAKDGEEIKAGTCYIAKSGYHMKVEAFEERELKLSKKVIHLSKEDRVSGYRPSIDVLMKSVVDNYQSACIGIILTGMGHDGLEGSKQIHANGGYLIAQSPQSAVIESMPRSIIDAGITNEVLSPGEIINVINSNCK